MTDPLPQDPTLDEVRDALAPVIAANAAFDGWSAVARDAAADALQVDRDIAALAFPGGAMDMIDAWFATVDAEMLVRVPAEALATMKVREKITALIEARLAIVAADREAQRRAIALFAMPHNIVRGVRLGWRTADIVWRAAGDTATDYNHYTKRAILAGVYATTITVFIDDESDGWADTRAFLARRIEGIMRFEKAKAQVLAQGDNLPSLSRFIGRLRYPVV